MFIFFKAKSVKDDTDAKPAESSTPFRVPSAPERDDLADQAEIFSLRAVLLKKVCALCVFVCVRACACLCVCVCLCGEKNLLLYFSVGGC